MVIGVIAVYLCIVLFVGALSHRLFRGTGEDYFVASRTIGPFLLLMSLFGTNMTAFSILGASGEAYHHGIGVFGLMGSSSAIVIPAIFLLVGTRLWRFGKRYGYVTQAQYFRDRYGSDTIGLLLFILSIALVVPYLLIGVMGGGITLNQITDGDVPLWVGSFVVCAVVLTYVCYGGLRGTAWANAFQTVVFMTLGAVTVGLIVSRHGGLDAALTAANSIHPGLLKREGMIGPAKFASYMMIPLSAGMFPHLFMHWLTAREVTSFRWPVILYPLCIAIVWLPSVLLGVVGRIDFPGLEGPAANAILVKMIDVHAPGILAGLLGAGVFAAVMSSLDSQVLAVGTMFTQDIVRHYGFHDGMSERHQVFYGRVFVAIVLAIVFALSLVVNRSIFRLGIWSFSGFAALFPVIVASVFWKRTTGPAVIVAFASVAASWVHFILQGWNDPAYTVAGTGLMPVVAMTVLSSVVLFVGSLVTSPPAPDRVSRFFSLAGHG